MSLAEIINNPLLVPLLVAVITIVSNVFFLYWLRRWQYKTEYVIRNVEKTYIPLLAEIHDRLVTFDRFLEKPRNLSYSFEKLDNIKKSGLLEFIKSHDKKLYGKLKFFDSEIRPKLKQLTELLATTRAAIKEEWSNHIKDAVSHSDTFVNRLLDRGLVVLLLHDKKEEISKIWNWSSSFMVHNYPNITQIQAAHIQRVFPEKIDELLNLSRPRIQKLLDFYNQLRTLVDDEVVNGLIPMMQKYITNPLSR